MIKEFCGEFLVYPVPLELSLDECSHGCRYCYARLNDKARGKKRAADMAGIVRQIKNFRGRKGVINELLSAGYPVLMSNHTDPFSKRNWRNTLSLSRLMASEGIPISFATKGGDGIDDMMKFLPPSVWYVTIESMDDAKMMAIDPGAPRVTDRIDLCGRLVSAGHSVIVGVNPAVPEWIGDPRPFLTALRGVGVHGVLVEALHFDHHQASVLSEDDIAIFGERAARDAHKRDLPGPEGELFDKMREACRVVGLEMHVGGQWQPSRLYDVFYQKYEKCFPIVRNMVNALYAGREDGYLFDIDDALGMMGWTLPNAQYNLDRYIQIHSRQIRKKYAKIPRMRYADLIKILWSHGEYVFHPSKIACLQMVVGKTPDGADAFAMSENGGPVLRFSRDLSDDEYFFDESVELEEIEK